MLGSQQNKYGYYGRTANFYSNSAATNKLPCVVLQSPNTDTISQIEFAPQGDPLLAACGWDQTIRFWRFDDWDYKKASTTKLVSDTAHNTILRFCFNSDCSQIYFGTTGGELKCWDLQRDVSTNSFGAFGSKTGQTFGGFGSKNGQPFGNLSTKTGQTGGFAFSNKNLTGQTSASTSQASRFTSTKSFGTGFGTKSQNPKPIDLKEVAKKLSSTEDFSDYLITGVKFNEAYQFVVVAFSTDGTAENNIPHSGIFFIYPEQEDACSPPPVLLQGKIITMDTVGNYIWLATLEDGVSNIGFYLISDLTAGKGQAKFTRIQKNEGGSEINSLITSIASLPQDETGYICSTIQGFVELFKLQETENLRANCGIFRDEANNKYETYSANCVAVCHENKKAAIACGRNQMALFNTENGRYKIYLPEPQKNSAVTHLKGSITACALSPDGESYAVAFGYDWSEGADGMEKYSKEGGRPQILVGQLPDPPPDEE